MEMAVSDMETSLDKMNETLELQKKLLMSLKTQQQTKNHGEDCVNNRKEHSIGDLCDDFK